MTPIRNRYCPLCSNDPVEPRIWCSVIEQPICSNCNDVLSNEFSQAADMGRDIERNSILDRLVDTAGMPMVECAAIWLLKDIDRLSEEFRDCYHFNEYATETWSRPMIRELIWRLNEIDVLSGLLAKMPVKETPQAKHHKI